MKGAEGKVTHKEPGRAKNDNSLERMEMTVKIVEK
jgi:hypothetical protein